ncbi:hypothetical protein BH10PSE12_BH10PSE12_02950 [soil metagenome]
MTWADDAIACTTCATRQDGVLAGMLPPGWNGQFLMGHGWSLFCQACADAGLMELHRAAHVGPRRQRWCYPDGIMGVYRPLAREVLLATPEGMAVMSEGDAMRLRDAIDGALLMRPRAEGMTA